MVEIVSFGKLSWVTDRRLFFRTVDDTRLGLYYRGRMMGHVEAGFLQRDDGRYVVKTCRMVRVDRTTLDGQLYTGRVPNRTPVWNGGVHQWQQVWVRVGEKAYRADEVSATAKEGFVEGRLVITGDVPGKKKEFVFLLPDADAEIIQVDDAILERFHDDAQITQWQESAFPSDQPQRQSRRRDGMVRDNPGVPGDPVFFLRESGRLVFFGRAQMFRLPYARTPHDLIPEHLRNPEVVDFADAIFGYVRTGREIAEMRARGVTIRKQGDKRRAYAGRVSVTDAVLHSAPKGLWLSEDPITPPILATPKPTAFQHYLTQQAPDDRRELDHYDSPPPHATVLRGTKRYWHRGNPDIQQLNTHPQDASSTQHTQVKPVRDGVTFAFRVYFENLSDAELGALAWALHPAGAPGADYCHKLGMGKPLGMGSVKLSTTLHLTDRRVRSTSLFDAAGGWHTGETAPPKDLSDSAVLDGLVHPFERHVLGQFQADHHERLRDLERIQELLAMLEWRKDTTDWRDQTRYMQLDEYRGRPVLPTPRGVLGAAGLGPAPSPGAAPRAGTSQDKSRAGTPPRGGPVPQTDPRSHSGGPTGGLPRGAAAQTGSQQSRTRQGRQAQATTVEVVSLASKLGPDRSATVTTQDGQRVRCTLIHTYPLMNRGDRFQAKVTRENGSPVRAEFHAQLKEGTV